MHVRLEIQLVTYLGCWVALGGDETYTSKHVERTNDINGLETWKENLEFQIRLPIQDTDV